MSAASHEPGVGLSGVFPDRVPENAAAFCTFDPVADDWFTARRTARLVASRVA